MIWTLTMNPALDVAFTVPELKIHSKLRCKKVRTTPGGGGINCSRAIVNLGGESAALFCSGGDVDGSIEHRLKALGVTTARVNIEGDTRLSLLVNPEEEEGEYRFILPGPELSEEEWRSALEKLDEVLEKDALLIASGSLPPGVPEDFYARVAAVANRRGARLFLDGPSAAVRKALAEEHLFAIKPNAKEWGRIRDCGTSRRNLIEEAETAVRKERRVEIILLSLGSEGAVCVTRDGSEYIESPPVDLVDTTGAGDSMFGAFALAIDRGKPLKEAARYAVAAGAATVERYGSELCTPEGVDKMLDKMRGQNE